MPEKYRPSYPETHRDSSEERLIELKADPLSDLEIGLQQLDPIKLPDSLHFPCWRKVPFEAVPLEDIQPTFHMELFVLDYFAYYGRKLGETILLQSHHH